jgi:hypothetical protein
MGEWNACACCAGCRKYLPLPRHHRCVVCVAHAICTAHALPALQMETCAVPCGTVGATTIAAATARQLLMHTCVELSLSSASCCRFVESDNPHDEYVVELPEAGDSSGGGGGAAAATAAQRRLRVGRGGVLRGDGAEGVDRALLLQLCQETLQVRCNCGKAVAVECPLARPGCAGAWARCCSCLSSCATASVQLAMRAVQRASVLCAYWQSEATWSQCAVGASACKRRAVTAALPSQHVFLSASKRVHTTPLRCAAAAAAPPLCTSAGDSTDGGRRGSGGRRRRSGCAHGTGAAVQGGEGAAAARGGGGAAGVNANAHTM